MGGGGGERGKWERLEEGGERKHIVTNFQEA